MANKYDSHEMDQAVYEDPVSVTRDNVYSTTQTKPKVEASNKLLTAACINWVVLILCLIMSSAALGVALYSLGISDGQPGEPGATGMPGSAGASGVNGRDGLVGAKGDPGADGQEGPMGLKGDPGSSGGAVYTRWGRTTCGADSTLVYDGFAVMSRYDHTGGGVNYQCMVSDPEDNKYTSSMSYSGFVVGVEYASQDYGIFEDAASLQNVPCAVCYANNRPSVLMIPGKRTCPSAVWHKEYEGYLMSERYNQVHPTTYECVDADPEYVEGLQGSHGGGFFVFNEPYCGRGVSCPPYFSERAITCVVCTM